VVSIPSHDVLLTDGDCRITLYILRSLRKRGIDTVVAADRERPLLFFSRFCRWRTCHPYPNPKENRRRFVESIIRLVQKNRFNVLFPVCEWGLLPLSEMRDKIEPYTKMPLPSHESLVKTFDKSQTIKIAKDNDVPTPETYFVQSTRRLREVSKKISYPAVIKPKWSWTWSEEKAIFRRASYVKSPAELITTYKAIHEQFPFPMIQEYIPGMARNYSIGVLYNNSRPRAMCAIKVYRAFPISGGNSILRETVELDCKMKEYASRLLKALDWHGIAEIEFKVDPRDGTPKLMEINGRFWASLEIAILSGVDLPYLLYRLTMDGDVPPVTGYKIGVKDRWLEGDIHHLYNVFRHKFGIQYPSRLRTLLDFFKIYEKDLYYDCYDPEDPLPFLVSLYRIKNKSI